MSISYEEKETAIQQALERHKTAKNQEKTQSELVKEFFALFSDDIYAYPLRFFNLDEDDAGDFYLYAFEHLRDGNKLNLYKGKSRFTTWLFAVLHNLCIDFLRSKKNKLRVTSFSKIDASQRVLNLVSQIADEPSRKLPDEELYQRFEDGLAELKLEQRVLFKLAYIHFFDLLPDEITFLTSKTDKPLLKVLTAIETIKEIALERANQVRKYEGQLSAYFQTMTLIESRLSVFFQENPLAPYEPDKWSENYNHSEVPIEISNLIQSLMKKKKRHTGLLVQQQRSLISLKVPYTEISKILGISEGVLSVQLARILEKLSNAAFSSNFR